MATKWWNDRLIEVRRSLGWRLYWWWMTVGFIAIPFGVIYGFVTLYLGHESLAVLLGILAAALFTIYKIQGMPPTK